MPFIAKFIIDIFFDVMSYHTTQVTVNENNGILIVEPPLKAALREYNVTFETTFNPNN
jgi:hypothetical protein